MVRVIAGVPVTLVEPLVPVIVKVYVFGGVPVLPPPPPPPLLPLLHAGRINRPATTIPSIRNPRTFLRRDPDAPSSAPSSAIPNTGIVAKKIPAGRPCCGCASIALDAAIVATFRVAVAVPPPAVGVTDAPGLLNVHVGPFVTEGVTAQARLTAELKPLTEVTVMVAVAETPGLPEVAERAPFVTRKLGEVL